MPTAKKLFTFIDDAENAFSVFIGFVFLLVATMTIVVNESKQHNASQALEQGIGKVISLQANAPVDKVNNGKLVHISGFTVSNETLEDPEFSVKAEGLKFERRVSMYQWEQKYIDGQYRYRQHWASQHIEVEEDTYKNPPLPITSAATYAKNVKVGSFTILGSFIDKLEESERIPLMEVKVPEQYIGKMHNIGYDFYMGENDASPKIGDLKISFYLTPPTEVSIVAEQNDNQLLPKVIKGESIYLVQKGRHSASEMGAEEKNSNRSQLWYQRFVGLIFMLFAATMMKNHLLSMVEKISGSTWLSRLDVRLSVPILAVAMTIIAIFLGLSMVYVPFMGYIIAAAFALAYVRMAVKMSASKTLTGKIMFFIMTLLVLLVVVGIFAFIYLTREG